SSEAGADTQVCPYANFGSTETRKRARVNNSRHIPVHAIANRSSRKIAVSFRFELQDSAHDRSRITPTKVSGRVPKIVGNRLAQVFPIRAPGLKSSIEAEDDNEFSENNNNWRSNLGSLSI